LRSARLQPCGNDCGENPVGDTRDLIPCRAGILGFRILP